MHFNFDDKRFCYPLIKISTEERLLDLQRGNLYLKNACYYRVIENGNKISGQADLLESSIPYYGNAFKSLPLEETEGHYSLVNPNTFISCFFGLNESNVVESSENWRIFRINRESDRILEFGDHALVIFPLEKIVQSFYDIKDYDNAFCGYVHYHDLSNQDVANKITEDLLKQRQGKTKKAILPELIKDSTYEYQQEFRFVVHTGFDPNVVVSEYSTNTLADYESKVSNKKITDNIRISFGNLEEISCICRTKDLLDKKLAIKWSPDGVSLGFL